MKIFRPHPSPVSDDPLPVIDHKAYVTLSEEEKKLYRPVNPQYEKLPRICIVFYALALVSLILYISFCLSPAFADFFNLHISAVGRTFLHLLTSPLPFSLGEACIWLLPLILVLALVYAVSKRCDTWKSALSYLGILLSVIALIFSMFTLNFAAGYRGTGLDQKLGLEQKPVDAAALYETADMLRKQINRESANIAYTEDGFSVMPYSLEEMNQKLNVAYRDFCEHHDFITHVDSRVKPVLASEAMSYLHITGVYTFFTGEANINVQFPDYTIPYTAAHEMAHQRGIAREDEANFVAFLICASSDDAYIRYSGYVNLYEYLVSALAEADYNRFALVHSQLSYLVQGEMSAYNRFFATYEDSKSSEISETVNNGFLQSQGTPGTVSYGMVVDLAVAYFRASSENHG